MKSRELHLLPGAAPVVVRHLARQLLEEAKRAFLRLADAADPEALHDLRVAVRRLRTLLRAYDDLFLVPKKVRRRLRSLARTTNEARDLEVARENLRAFAGETTIDTLLTERLAARHAQVRAATIDEVKKAWPPLALRLSAALDQEPRESAPLFRESTTQRVTTEWSHLQQLLQELRDNWDDERAHRARLAGKRLRYLLEPLTTEVTGAKRAVSALKIFQDQFGLYHDLWVLLGMVAEFAAEASAMATHARVCSGSGATLPVEPFVALADRLREERTRLAARLAADYLAPGARALQPVAPAITAFTAP